MSDLVRQRLSAPGPKRILSLDGGGTRGIITIQFLKKIEELLAKRFVQQGYYEQADQFRLSHYFDLIGGTSVGALIAAQLAKGETVATIERRFLEWMPVIFKKALFSIQGVQILYGAGGLTERLKDVFGEARLEDGCFHTGLAIISKRADTGSVWPMFNNPASKYWNTPAAAPNRRYLIHELLRASSAAPTYFRPKKITVHPKTDAAESEQIGSFVDGAVSPHNNPSLQLFLMARVPGYQLNWRGDPENLLITNVGTGMHPTIVKERLLFLEAIDNLSSMIGDAEQLVLTLMQTLACPRDPWRVDSEIETLTGPKLAGAAQLSFQRYDVPLDAKWLAPSGKSRAGRTVGAALADEIRQMGGADAVRARLPALQALIAPECVYTLKHLSAAAAIDQVMPDDFPAAFDTLWGRSIGPAGIAVL